MRILFATAEAAPFSKTGGLADVSGALPKALANLGVDCKLILPYYKMTKEKSFDITPLELDNIRVTAGESSYELSYHTGYLPESGVEAVFIWNEELFGREGIYMDPANGEGYEDNDVRFIVYQRGILEYLKESSWMPDLIHLNDNHTALIPAYTDELYPEFGKIATLLTIHNLGYQGIFPAESIKLSGFDESLFSSMSPFEFYGKLNFMKIGITSTDVINTVSEKYAKEITMPEYGEELESILRDREDDLFGILNGIDTDEWNPATDTLIPSRYSAEEIDGKAANKKILLRESGLDRANIENPLLGVVSRLADQKGFDLIEGVMDKLMENNITFVLLGTGEAKYHSLFEDLKERYPLKMGIHLSFDNRLAHLIEAGADMFLMPSRYEPCGLNQMYSLNYGTVPIVRATGGLADTVIDYEPDSDRGTGFVFEEYTSEALYGAVRRGLDAFEDNEVWRRIMTRGMKEDFSWDTSARKYIKLYEMAIAKKNSG